MRRINFSEGTTITTQVTITEVNSYYFAFTLSSKLNFFILGFGLGCQQKLASRCRGSSFSSWKLDTEAYTLVEDIYIYIYITDITSDIIINIYNHII